MSATGLRADFVVRRGAFELELRLETDAGRVTALVGPNGAGKSTALRTLAGLLRPTAGRITVGDRVLDDVTAGRHVPPPARGVGVVFQDYRLFPHLTAAENTAFGLLARGGDHRSALARGRAELDALGVGPQADARPRALSGGQAQRVALARALATDPAVLLLDEPLAALDASVRLEVRAVLAERLHAFAGATVLVTHDPADAIALGDEVVVVENGAVRQRGDAETIARAPASAYVADLLGLALVPLPGGRTVVVEPELIRISRERPPEASAGSVPAVVRGSEPAGRRVRVLLESREGGARFSAAVDARAFDARRFAAGEAVWASIPNES